MIFTMLNVILQRCVLKDGAYGLVGVPSRTNGDYIKFNLHRVYGPVMFSHLLANWEQVYFPSPRVDWQNPMIVRKNTSLFAP